MITSNVTSREKPRYLRYQYNYTLCNRWTRDPLVLWRYLLLLSHRLRVFELIGIMEVLKFIFDKCSENEIEVYLLLGMYKVAHFSKYPNTLQH